MRKNELIPVSQYNTKRLQLEEDKNYLKDYCDQIIRRMVTLTLKAQPENVLEFMSEWVSKESGIPLSDIEQDVLDNVKKNRITKDDRKYVLNRRPTVRIMETDDQKIVILDGNEHLGKLDEEFNLNSVNGSSLIPSVKEIENYVDKSDEEFKYVPGLSFKTRAMRLLKTCFLTKVLSMKKKEDLVRNLIEAKYT